jgi:Rad3-related DNA helicase
MLGFATYAALLPELRDLWQLSNAEAGLIGSAFFIGYIATVSYWTALTDRIEVAATTLGDIFSCEDTNKVSWIETKASKVGRRITLKQAPLNISELLRERIFQKFPTVVMTSATLTTEGQFNYLKGRLGLDEMPSIRLLELVLPPPFNYAQQVVLGVPKDIPLPDHPAFQLGEHGGHLVALDRALPDDDAQAVSRPGRSCARR